jgi:hypothetical protein
LRGRILPLWLRCNGLLGMQSGAPLQVGRPDDDDRLGPASLVA